MRLDFLLRNILWILLGLLFAFDDIAFLERIGGPYLASPAWILIIPILIKTRPHLFSADMPIKLILITFVMTVISLYQYSQISLVGLEQSILLKIIKNILEFIVYIVFIFIGFQLAIKLEGKQSILLVGGAFYMANFTGYLLEKFSSSLSFENFFHATTNIQQRARGFRFEASSFGSSFLIATSLIIICLSGRKFFQAVLTLLTLPLLIVESRGYILTLFIVIAVLLSRLLFGLIRKSNKSRIGSSWFEVSTLLVMLFCLPIAVQSNLWRAYSADVSDTTRSMWSLVSLFVLFNFPFGMGFGNSVALLPKLISNEVVPFMQSNFIDGNYSEISNMLASQSDSGMYPKTLPGYIILVSGLFGFTLFLFIFKKIVSHCKTLSSSEGFPIYVGFFLLITVSSTYFGSSFSWDQAFLFGAVYGFIKVATMQRDISNAEK